MLPFDRAQFFDVFARYNLAIWPAQVLIGVLGLAMVGVLVLRPRPADRFIAIGLAAMWAWTGVAYFGVHFATINPAAPFFAALYVLQSALLLHAALRGSLRFTVERTSAAAMGWLLVVYASLVYPLVGASTGHGYPAMPMFGVTPCPVTIFTIGMLLLTREMPWWLLPIPLAWSIVGGSAAFLLGVPQDWALLLSGIALWPLVLRRRRRQRQPTGA